MEVFAPTVLLTIGSSSQIHDDERGLIYLRYPESFNSMEDGYFRDEDGHPENRVVHSKPYDGVQRKLVKDVSWKSNTGLWYGTSLLYTKGAPAYAFVRPESTMYITIGQKTSGVKTYPSYVRFFITPHRSIIRGRQEVVPIVNTLQSGGSYAYNPWQVAIDAAYDLIRDDSYLATDSAAVKQRIRLGWLKSVASLATAVVTDFESRYTSLPSTTTYFTFPRVIQRITVQEGWIKPTPTDPGFLFKEPDWIFSKGNGILLGRSPVFYQLNLLRYHAIYDALNQLPTMNDNNFQNITAIVNFIRGLVFEHRVELPKSAGAAWLSYRYAFSTSKEDIREAVSFLRRNISVLNTGLTSYGKVSTLVDSTVVTVKCALKVRKKHLTYLNKILDALYMYGLSPDFYVLWDSIPYSFIVDWFIPIGDMLSAIDKWNTYSTENYEYQSIVMSISYDRDGYKCYSRWIEDSLPDFNMMYWLESPSDPSKTTILKRVADTFALITG